MAPQAIQAERIDEDIRRLSESRREPEWIADDRLSARLEWAEAETALAASGRRVPALVAADDALKIPASIESVKNLSDVDMPIDVQAPAGVTVLPLAEAVVRYPQLVRDSLAAVALRAGRTGRRGQQAASPGLETPKPQRDRRNLLDVERSINMARALWTGGVFVYVPEETALTEPVVLRFGGEAFEAARSGSASKGLVALRNLVAAGRHSRATVIELWGAGVDGAGSPGFGGSSVLAATEVVAADGAAITFAQVQKLAPEADCAFNVTGTLGRHARLHWVTAGVGGQAVFSTTALALGGEGAEADGVLLFVGTDDDRRDVRAIVEHEAPHTKSNLTVRGALSGRARASVAGYADIANGAKATSGWQTVKTLLLSPDARIDALPALEIDDWDVDAGHAASAGSVDEAALYYLMSRGIPREVATAMLVEAFVEPIVRSLPGKGLPEKILALVRNKVANEVAGLAPAEGVGI